MINIDEGEKIIKMVRRHYLVLVPLLLSIIFAAIVPILLYFFMISDFLPWTEEIKNAIVDFVREWKVFAYALWLLLLWVFFFIEWTDYYLDLWLVTDKRIIDIEQKGFFHRDVTSFRYEDIQDITVETRGFIETLFKFGTLHIQTAGHNRQILIRDAYDPEGARALILELQTKNRITS